MQYRSYGKTQKKISVLGFGGMRLPKEDDRAYTIVKKACDLGINYFDTAPSYCGWRSERIIGEAVKDSGKEVYIADKSMVDYDSTADALRKRLEESLKIMQLRKMSFYQMWDVSTWEKFERVIKKGGPYDGAVKAKKEGLIEHIVLSSHADGKTVERMLKTDLFEGVTLGYNIINSDYRTEGIEAAGKKGIGIAVMNSLAGGIIPLARDYFSDLGKKENDLSPISVALKFVLMTPGITTALSGVKTVEELEENVQAVEKETPYDEDAVNRLKGYFKSLNQRFCTYCWYCLPCPQKIPIPQYLSAWNIARLKKEENAYVYIRENIAGLKNMSGLAGDCTECGECESRCTQKLDCITILKEMGKKYDEFIAAERARLDSDQGSKK